MFKFHLIICFDHRKKSVLSQVPSIYDHPEKLSVHVDLEKCSSKAAYEYFSRKFAETKSSHLSKGDSVSFLMPEEKDRVETVLTYVEDIDLRRWNLPDIKAFSIGVKQWNSNINCITNPYMYKQLLKISTEGLISSGNSYISYQQIAANKLMDKVFKIRLGRGFYGECLGVKIDGNSNLSDEIGKQLSLKSAAAGLRPIGAVVCMQRKNLKMCLRSTDSTTDTSEVAKAYGGGGSPSSSSFIIRMDEYNQWVSGPAM